jgi:hypothetical protein
MQVYSDDQAGQTDGQQGVDHDTSTPEFFRGK